MLDKIGTRQALIGLAGSLAVVAILLRTQILPSQPQTIIVTPTPGTEEYLEARATAGALAAQTTVTPAASASGISTPADTVPAGVIPASGKVSASFTFDPSAPPNLAGLIESSATAKGLDPDYVAAIVYATSRGNPRYVTGVTCVAKGIIPVWEGNFVEGQIAFDPEDNFSKAMMLMGFAVDKSGTRDVRSATSHVVYRLTVGFISGADWLDKPESEWKPEAKELAAKVSQIYDAARTGLPIPDLRWLTDRQPCVSGQNGDSHETLR